MVATNLSSLQVAGVPTMGMSGIPPTIGNVYFVDSTTPSNTSFGTADFPDKTLAAAYARCVADNGDTVVVAASHAETISTAGGINLNKSGVTIVGLGVGADRPQFTFATSTAATLTMTAANNSLTNIVGINAIDQIVSPFVVSAADCTLGVEWHEGATNATQAVRVVLTTAGATRFTCNLVYKGYITGGTSPVNGIRLVGVAGGYINVDFYGQASTAIVEFVTTACTNIEVTGYFYNAALSDFSKNVIDTQGSSKWSVNAFDGVAGLPFVGSNVAAIASGGNASFAATAANSTNTALVGDTVGNKGDTAVTAVGTTKSIEAYVKGLITMNTVQTQDNTADAFAGDVIGNKTDTAVYTPGTTKSLVAYTKGAVDVAEGVSVRAAAVLVNGGTLFTIAGGPIEIIQLYAYCVTACDATASTLQFSSTPTLGSAKTISAASASLTSFAAGGSVTLNATSLATAPDVVTGANGGVAIGANVANKIIVNAGTLTSVVGTGSTTGTFTIHIRYRPLAKGVTVV